jgi:hypothetical protein
VISRPPFESKLTLEEELRAFERLKPRLSEVWDAIVRSGDAEPYTSVVVPSMTLDQEELVKLSGATFYEERLLFLLIRLRNPRARVVFITSQPVHPHILEYYFGMLAGVPAHHAWARVTMLCAHDASPRSLTEKILERPRLIQRIRAAIPDKSRAYLTVFNSTPLERKLSVLLDIPMNGVDPVLRHLGTKSGCRKIFREAGVDLPLGMEDLRTEDDVARALVELKDRRPGLRKAVVKLNDSFSGEGNALFRYPEAASETSIRTAMRMMEMPVPEETYDRFFEKYARMGGIVEEWLEGEEKTSPSVQLRCDPHGMVIPISTHDQILGGPSGQIFLGCLFPAHDDYRMRIQEAGLRIGAALASHGVVSRFGVDFMCLRNRGAREWDFYALEINLRMGGTTHPFVALQFITGGKLDEQTGLFHSVRGHTKCYRATDNLWSEAYRGLGPDDFIEVVTQHRLHYSHTTESGVLFHLIGALSEFGKVGLTAIGNTREEVDQVYQRTLQILDAETRYGPHAE